MKKSIIEVIKANKKAIIKKSLIVVGTTAGLAIAAVVLGKRNADEDEEIELLETEETDSEDVE